MDDPVNLANLYYEKMTQAYQESQLAWKEGRKADAKKFSEELKIYKEKMNEYKEKAKELNEKQKLENDCQLPERIEVFISKEFENIQKNCNDLQSLKKLNEEYVNKMKINYDNSQNCFKNGLKAQAKEYSEFGKAYKTLVQLSNDYLKEVKKVNSVKSKQVTETQLREMMNKKICNLNGDEFIEYGEERIFAQRFAEEMKKQYNLAQIAWNNNDKEAAKKHSDQASNYKEYMEYYNNLAAKNALVKNNYNKDTKSILDLHGLTVNEASCVLDEKVKQCTNDNIKDLKIIVGKGLHSGEKGPKLKSLVIEYATQRLIEYVVDPINEGCVLYYF